MYAFWLKVILKFIHYFQIQLMNIKEKLLIFKLLYSTRVKLSTRGRKLFIWIGPYLLKKVLCRSMKQSFVAII